MDVESLVRSAQAGDKAALSEIVTAIQDDVYQLAIRMLADPGRAEDATQEILILVITKLSTFAHRSAFKTWVFRVASNHLLAASRRQADDPVLTFDAYRADLEVDLRDPGVLADSPDYALLLNEVRIGCTMAMLLCLDSKHRLAYILGEIFELGHSEASSILGLRPAAFRQQLSRARAKVVEFTRASCGLVSSCASCSCDRKLAGAIDRGRVEPHSIRLAKASTETYAAVRERVAQTLDQLKTLEMQAAVPRFGCREDFGRTLVSLVEGTSGRPSATPP